MIVSSFRAQYGVKIHSNEFKEMRWDEFVDLLSGLGPETPLGRIVAIRLEDDKNILKQFTKEQRRIRNEWRLKQAKSVKSEEMEKVLDGFKNAFIQMAGGVKPLKMKD